MEKIEHKTVATNGINMHVATIGTGPAILFLHGFPELWYSWRHQLLSLSSLGYRCIAPDLRGFGDSDAPHSVSHYTSFHVVGDLIGVLDALGIQQVFLVGHDWGAIIAWHFCLFRPDRVKALVNTSVQFMPRNPFVKPVEGFRASLGDDFYVVRFQEPGEAEKYYDQVDIVILMKTFLTNRKTDPPRIPKERGSTTTNNNKGSSYESYPEIRLPPWLSEDDINYYASKFKRTGFTGGLNYYRAMDLTWEVMAPWTGCQVKVPTKFIVGDEDLTYHLPGVKDYIHKGGFKKDVPFLEEVVVMEGVAHFLNQEKPEEVTKHIHDFFKKF